MKVKLRGLITVKMVKNNTVKAEMKEQLDDVMIIKND